MLINFCKINKHIKILKVIFKNYFSWNKHDFNKKINKIIEKNTVSSLKNNNLYIFVVQNKWQ